MASKLTILIHKIAIQLHLVAESCTICSPRSRRPARKLLDISSYYYSDEVKENGWVGQLTCMGDMRSAYKSVVGVPERKRLLGRPRHRWEDNIRMNLREVRWKGMDWVCMAQDRDQWRTVVNTVMNLRVP
jgi:hypothetical protein